MALAESDPELTAMLSRAAESVGLYWRPPPSHERSRLDDWFLGAQADRWQPIGESFVSFLFCSPTGPLSQWYPKPQKRADFIFLRVPRG